MAQKTSQKDPDKPTATAQTRWMKKNDLIRPGIYIPRESWEKFERAL